MPVPPPPTTLGRADNWIMAGRQLSPWRGLSVSITCLSSTSPSCVERCRRTSLILIIGVRIDRFASVRPAIWQCLMFDLERPAARSSRSLHLELAPPIGGIVEDRRIDVGAQRGLTLATRSDLPIKVQITAVGATWLDRQLVSRERVSLSEAGFGHEVRQALQARIDHLAAEGLARREGLALFSLGNSLKPFADASSTL
jgi:Protein of unknown function (DUF3363)